MDRFLRRLCVPILSLLFALGPIGAGAAADPIDIYVLFPLTGYGAFFGVPQVQAVKGIEDYVNRTGGIQGHPVHFIVEDDATNPTLDVQLAGAVFAKKSNVLLGPDTVGQCNAVMPLAKAGPAMYCFTTGVHPTPGGYVFATGPETHFLVDAAFRYLAERGLKRVATLSSIDATGQEGDRVMQAAAAANGVTIVDRQFFNVTDVTVGAQIAHIKGSDPQAIFAYTTGTPFGTVMRSIQEAGLDLPVMCSSGNLLYDEMRQYAGILPKELLSPGQIFLDPSIATDKGVKDAITLLYSEMAAQGTKPDQGQNSVWDGAMIVMDALRKLGPNATPDQIRSYIANTKGWAGIDGRYDFKAQPQRGLGAESVVVVRWDAVKKSFVAVSHPGGTPL
jgi:branched-chain amino acid transport system substrate-binding protein